MANQTDDPRLEEIQDRVDEVRRRLPDNPGLDVIDEDDVPAYFEDDLPDEGVSKQEAQRRDDPEEHQGHAPG